MHGISSEKISNTKQNSSILSSQYSWISACLKLTLLDKKPGRAFLNRLPSLKHNKNSTHQDRSVCIINEYNNQFSVNFQEQNKC